MSATNNLNFEGGGDKLNYMQHPTSQNCILTYSCFYSNR